MSGICSSIWRLAWLHLLACLAGFDSCIVTEGFVQIACVLLRIYVGPYLGHGTLGRA